jgi:hypothetical protein
MPLRNSGVSQQDNSNYKNSCDRLVLKSHLPRHGNVTTATAWFRSNICFSTIRPPSCWSVLLQGDPDTIIGCS